MKTFFSDLIPKVSRYSDKLDNLTLLTDQHWVSLGELSDTKVVYIFRPNGDLLISRNGIVEKARWEYLGHKSLLLETKAENYLFKQDFNDGNVLALRVDSKDLYAFLINESKFNSELNSMEAVNYFLKSKYLDRNVKIPISGETAIHLPPSECNISYEIIKEKERFDIFFGNYREFIVRYMDGNIQKVYQGKRSGRYYYVINVVEIFYYDNLEETIIAYYKHLINNNPAK